MGSVYNLGGGARVRVNAVLRGLKKIVGKRLRVRLAEGLRAEVEWVRGGQ